MERSQAMAELRPEPFLIQANSKPPFLRKRRRIVAVTAASMALGAVALLVLAATGSLQPAQVSTSRARPGFLAMSEAYSKMQQLEESAPTTYCLDGEGYAKPAGGSMSVARVNGIGNLDQYYYLSVMGEVGHEIRAVLEGSDGYHNSWTNFGSIWTDKIHNEKARSSGIVDYLQVQDLQTGEIAYFRFPCGDGALNGEGNKETKEEMPEAECFGKGGDGYRKVAGGSLSVSKVNGITSNKDCYYLTIMGEVGHKITAILEGSDGYHRHWSSYGSIWSDCVHQGDGTGSRGQTHDFLQVQDEQTGETAYFEWPCRNPAKYIGATGAVDFPPMCKAQQAGLGFSKSVCFGDQSTACEVCITGEGYCKPTGGSLSVSKVDGFAALEDYYYLSVMGEVGHPIKAILQGSDGYHMNWDNYGSIWTDKIHKPGHGGRVADAVDHLQVQDQTTGEIAFFRFPCSPDPVVEAETPSESAPAPAPAPAPAVNTVNSVVGNTPVSGSASPAAAPAVVAAPVGGYHFEEGKIEAPAGPPGPPGPPGSDGVVAIKIIPGPPGPPGPPGKPGISTERVIVGPSGPSGPQGPDGQTVTKYYHAVPGAGGAVSGPAVPAECVWSYAGATGVKHWGELCEGKYSLCAKGASQSPINIETSAIVASKDLPNIGWNIPIGAYDKYVGASKGQTGEGEEAYTQYMYEVSHVEATIQWEGTEYSLKQFQLHTTSEHTFDGKPLDMEMQFVHEAVVDGVSKVLIISAFFVAEEGQGSAPFIRELVKAIPSLSSSPTQIVPIDFAEMSQLIMIGSIPHKGANPETFVPNFKNYLAYSGSYTSPPCTEGVQWVLLRNPIHIYKEDLTAIAKLQGTNVRPVQPLGGRTVQSTVV